MKLLKPKKVPKKIMRFVKMAYDWGYTDKEKGLGKKTEKELAESVNRGYKKSLEKRKN